jgi:hypothetical protein
VDREEAVATTSLIMPEATEKTEVKEATTKVDTAKVRPDMAVAEVVVEAATEVEEEGTEEVAMEVMAIEDMTATKAAVVEVTVEGATTTAAVEDTSSVVAEEVAVVEDTMETEGVASARNLHNLSLQFQ